MLYPTILRGLRTAALWRNCGLLSKILGQSSGESLQFLLSAVHGPRPHFVLARWSRTVCSTKMKHPPPLSEIPTDEAHSPRPGDDPLAEAA
ncbi:Uncharacterized protein APZ42_002792 [Daphnia magna]|uniref:Uncharacterized protein n=1 Tax=Daphnia magna TaxID=35525 RepID=A0A164I1E1_9CRUS|nr:Uncharacterized protein APZ42_002792 [Daphnia magna]